MRIIKLHDYNVDTMQLAEPVYDKYQRVLLGKHTTIHPKYMQVLDNLGVSYIVVEDAESKGITLDEMLDMPTWIESIQALQEIVGQFEGRKVVVQSIHKLSSQLIREVKNRKVVVLTPSTVLSTEQHPYAHAVNVTLLALQMGKHLGYNDLQLRDLAIGCLLHDIGKWFTDDEKQHPIVGFNQLREVRELNLLSAHVAYQHHEMLDGSGYPRQLQGDGWHEYAQVCGLANYYDNLISVQKVLPHHALEKIMSLSDYKYSTHIVDAFVKKIPVYPPGTKVVLSDNETYIVTKIEEHLQRPTIKHLSTGKEISLASNLTMFITGCVV